MFPIHIDESQTHFAVIDFQPIECLTGGEFMRLKDLNIVISQTKAWTVAQENQEDSGVLIQDAAQLSRLRSNPDHSDKSLCFTEFIRVAGIHDASQVILTVRVQVAPDRTLYHPPGRKEILDPANRLRNRTSLLNLEFNGRIGLDKSG